MNSYTITIAPNNDSGNSTTLIVDTSGDEVRITDVHLHATGGLSGGQMPNVDFGLLLRAVAAPSSTPATITATPAPRDAASPADETADEAAGQRPTTADEEHPPPALTSTPPAHPPASRRRTKTAPVRPAHEPSTRAGRAPAAKTTTASKDTTAVPKRPTSATAKPRKKAPSEKGAAAGDTGRAYRRMPDDLASVYQRANTTAAIADHYGVPRHTAQGWIRRLRAMDAEATNLNPEAARRRR